MHTYITNLTCSPLHYCTGINLYIYINKLIPRYAYLCIHVHTFKHTCGTHVEGTGTLETTFTMHNT